MTPSEAPGAESLVTFARVAMSPPPLRELLDVRPTARRPAGARTVRSSDGSPAARTRSSRWARRSPIVAAGTERATAPLELVPDAAWEEVTAAGQTARFAADDEVDGPWGAVVDRCRSLLDEVSESPVAAIAIVLGTDGHVRLEHRGDGTLPVELGSLQVSLTLWRDSREAARAATGMSVGRVEAGPGWALDVTDASIDLQGGGTLVAVASFIADDDGVFVPMALTGHVAV